MRPATSTAAAVKASGPNGKVQIKHLLGWAAKNCTEQMLIGFLSLHLLAVVFCAAFSLKKKAEKVHFW